MGVGGNEREERGGGWEGEGEGGWEGGGIPRMGVWGWGVLWWRGAESLPILHTHVGMVDRGPLPELSTSPGQKEGQDPGIWSQKRVFSRKLELNGPNSANLEPK